MPAVIWYSITQSLRSNVMGMLIVVLVTLSGIFMFLSVSTWLTAKTAYPKRKSIYYHCCSFGERILKNVNTYTKGIYEYNSLADIYEAAEQSEHVEQVDIRDKCMAYNNGIKTISSGIVDEFTPITAVDYPYDLSVVVGTCVSVEYTVGAERENVFGSFGDTDVFLAYTAVLELDRTESTVLSEE